MADETKTNATPEAPGGPPAPEQTEQSVIPGMDGGPAPPPARALPLNPPRKRPRPLRLNLPSPVTRPAP